MFLKTSKIILFFHCMIVLPAIDVVIPCHIKDAHKIDLAINNIRKYGKDINRVIVVSETRLTTQAEWFDEQQYPFNKTDIALAICNNNHKKTQGLLQKKRIIGWIYQQLLKLYAPFVIPDISSDVLVLDGDTIFLQPVEFIDHNGYALFNVGTEYHVPYFEHANRLLPGFKKLFPHYSGITHHMLFQKPILDDLFSTIRNIHNKEPWQALCSCINQESVFSQRMSDNSCMSEYELYFNYAFSGNFKVKIRPLRFINSRFNKENIKNKRKEGFDYISCHTIIV